MLGPGQLALVEKVRKLSGGSIDMRFFEPGALVPASQYFDAVSNGSLDVGLERARLLHRQGHRLRAVLVGAVRAGDGRVPGAGCATAAASSSCRSWRASTTSKPLLCGTIAPEASGWFRKEIKSVDDLKGLKMRFFGLGAVVMQKLGVSTQILQAGEIFQALQLGTIDATEFSMPVMDLTLGFHQVAKHYYFPGWHQMATFLHLLVSKQKWAELSDTQKEIIKTACDATMLQQLPRGRGGCKPGDQGDPVEGRDDPLLAEGNPRHLRAHLGRGRQGAAGQEPGIRQSLGLALEVPRGVQDLARPRLSASE